MRWFGDYPAPCPHIGALGMGPPSKSHCGHMAPVAVVACVSVQRDGMTEGLLLHLGSSSPCGKCSLGLGGLPLCSNLLYFWPWCWENGFISIFIVTRLGKRWSEMQRGGGRPARPAPWRRQWNLSPHGGTSFRAWVPASVQNSACPLAPGVALLTFSKGKSH